MATSRDGPADRLAAEAHAAARRRKQAGEQPQQRGLAAARRADDAHELAAPHRERDVAQDRPPAETEVDALESEGRLGLLALARRSASRNDDFSTSRLRAQHVLPLHDVDPAAHAGLGHLCLPAAELHEFMPAITSGGILMKLAEEARTAASSLSAIAAPSAIAS